MDNAYTYLNIRSTGFNHSNMYLLAVTKRIILRINALDIQTCNVYKYLNLKGFYYNHSNP